MKNKNDQSDQNGHCLFNFQEVKYSCFLTEGFREAISVIVSAYKNGLPLLKPVGQSSLASYKKAEEAVALCEQVLARFPASTQSPGRFRDEIEEIVKNIKPSFLLRVTRMSYLQPLYEKLAALLNDKRYAKYELISAAFEAYVEYSSNLLVSQRTTELAVTSGALKHQVVLLNQEIERLLRENEALLQDREEILKSAKSDNSQDFQNVLNKKTSKIAVLEKESASLRAENEELKLKLKAANELNAQQSQTLALRSLEIKSKSERIKELMEQKELQQSFNKVNEEINRVCSF